VATGVISDEEMFACQAEFYEADPTRLQLWDMSEADLKAITSEGLRRFVKRSAELGKVRPNGRTAVLVRTPLQFGLARMAEMFGENASLPFELRAFQDRTEALAWLNEPRDE